MKTLIIYHSNKGTTRKFAENIAGFMGRFKSNTVVKTIEEANIQDINSCDLLVLGCWTKGRFLQGQQPQKEWVDFVQKLPSLEGKETILFTTYKIRTGSMFQNMKNYLLPKGYKIRSSIKSRSGELNFNSAVAIKYAMNYKEAI
jgi:flavodoxin